MRYTPSTRGWRRDEGRKREGAKKKFSLENLGLAVEDAEEGGTGSGGGGSLLFNLINEVVGRPGAQCAVRSATQSNGGDIYCSELIQCRKLALYVCTSQVVDAYRRARARAVS